MIGTPSKERFCTKRTPPGALRKERDPGVFSSCAHPSEKYAPGRLIRLPAASAVAFPLEMLNKERLGLRQSKKTKANGRSCALHSTDSLTYRRKCDTAISLSPQNHSGSLWQASPRNHLFLTILKLRSSICSGHNRQPAIGRHHPSQFV